MEFNVGPQFRDNRSSQDMFLTPLAFKFLYENQLFLPFRNSNVAIWNFRGELVTSLEEQLLWHPVYNTNNFYITNQDHIISYCKFDTNITSSADAQDMFGAN